MMIVLKDLNFSFHNKKVLNTVNAVFEPGEFIGIIGPNGSGKSTLLRLISGYYQPNSGVVQINKKNVLHYSKKSRAKLLAVVSQYNLINQLYTVQHLLELGREPHLSFFKRLGTADQQLIENISQELQLTNLLTNTVKHLSGGEQQRALIARALIQDTPYLLMDEPTNHLDIHYQIKILKLLKQYQKKGKTIIAVFHDINFAARFSDKLLILNRELVDFGKPEQVLSSELMEKVFQTSDFQVKNGRVVLK